MSPFIGRIDDTGHDGMELIAEIMTTWDHYDWMKVLATPFATQRMFCNAFNWCPHTATMPPKPSDN